MKIFKNYNNFKNIIINIFTKKYLGIDISDHSIELVELTMAGGQAKILHSTRIILKPGIVERGIIKDKEELKQALLRAMNQARISISNIREAVFGLSETCFYVHTIDQLQPLTPGLVRQEALANIPLEADRLICVYNVLEQVDNSEDKKFTLIIGADKNILSSWQDFFVSLKIKITLFDLEILAVRRALDLSSKDSFCLLDLGANTSSISAFIGNYLYYSFASFHAGKSISRKIADNLKMSLEDAEKLKITLDILDKKNSASVLAREELEKVSTELKNFIRFFNKKTGKKITKVVLCGGTSKFKNIKQFFANHLPNIKIELAQPIKLNKKISADFIGALGLALKPLDKKQLNKQPYFKTSFKLEPCRFLRAWQQSQFRSIFIHLRKYLFWIVGITILIALITGTLWFAAQKAEKKSIIPKFSQPQTIQPQTLIPEVKEEKEEKKEKKEKKESEEASKQEESLKIYIKIINTKGKRVNIRKGPGTNFKIVGKAQEGDKYEFVTEKDGWTKIILPTGEEGWIYSLLTIH